MEVICDTSFLMILCYEPIKNLDILELKFGKITFLIHPMIIHELSKIKQNDGVKKSKIANLSLEVIANQTEKGNFKYITQPADNGLDHKINDRLDVDSFLLSLALEKKSPLATIDKTLIKRSLRKGIDIITLKDNKIIFIPSKFRSNLNYS